MKSIIIHHKLSIILGLTIGLVTTYLLAYADTTLLSLPEENEAMSEHLPLEEEGVTKSETVASEEAPDITDSLLEVETETGEIMANPTDPDTAEEPAVSKDTPSIEATANEEEDDIAHIPDTNETSLLEDPDDTWRPQDPRDCIRGPARAYFPNPGECLRELSTRS